MARDYGQVLDLHGLEIRNPKFHLLASDPGSPAEGDYWINVTSHLMKYYDGTSTIVLGTLDKLSKAVADVDINSNKLINVDDPTNPQDAATRGYVLGLTISELTALAVDYSFNSHKLTNLTDGSSAGDAVNKGQLDAVSAAISAIASGISWKDSVRAVALSNGTLATAFENGDTLDGVSLATGDRILLAAQTAGAENGIYVVAASGAPSRATDADSAADLRGTFVGVEEGTGENPGSIYYLATDNITLGTTALVWTRFTGATYSAGAGLTLTGTTFAVGAGTGIVVNADDVAIDPAVVVRKYAADIGDNSTTSIVVTHNLNTRDVTVAVFDNTTPWGEIYPEVRHTSVNTVTLVFAVAPTAAQYRAVVHA